MTDSLEAKIVAVIRQVVGTDAPLALHEPTFSRREQELVVECIESGWVSSVGKFVDQFESMLAAYHGVASAVAVSNGTAALHIALKLAGVNPSDEVILPALTFVATANAVSYIGAVPHFVDSEERSFGIDPFALEDYLRDILVRRGSDVVNRFTERRVKAIVPVHIFGMPVDLDPLLDVASRFNLTLVEDAAESLGSTYRGRKTGTFGKLAALSFNGNKIVTTGGGGAILTADPALGKMAKHITTTARRAHRWEYFHEIVGYNYRMPNLNAALGVAQLEKLDELVQRKRELACRYRDAFADMADVRFVTEPEYSMSNAWLNAILVPAELRDPILQRCHEANLFCRPVWRLMNELPMYTECPAMPLTVAQRLEQTVVNIPSSAHLVASQI